MRVNNITHEQCMGAYAHVPILGLKIVWKKAEKKKNSKAKEEEGRKNQTEYQNNRMWAFRMEARFIAAAENSGSHSKWDVIYGTIVFTWSVRKPKNKSPKTVKSQRKPFQLFHFLIVHIFIWNFIITFHKFFLVFVFF